MPSRLNGMATALMVKNLKQGLGPILPRVYKSWSRQKAYEVGRLKQSDKTRDRVNTIRSKDVKS